MKIATIVVTVIDIFLADMKGTTKIENKDIKRDEVSEILSSEFCVSFSSHCVKTISN